MSYKSSIGDFRKRGMAEQPDIDRLSSFTIEQLIQHINAKSPTDRTAAIRLLIQNNACIDETCSTVLLARLSLEKALYTRLEICSALEKGDYNTARQMTRYLGKIGNNQHKSLPEAVSRKKSFPLPRDIIARALGNMNPVVLPALLDVLASGEKRSIYEAIDSIGFLVFYHQELAAAANLKHLINLLQMFPQDEMILWKTTLCLSAFPLQESIAVLNQIRQSTEKPLILAEAERSLSLLARKGIKNTR